MTGHAAKAGASHAAKTAANHAAKVGATHAVRAGTNQATQVTASTKAAQVTKAANSSALKSISYIAGPVLTGAAGNILSDTIKDLVKRGVEAVNNRKSE